MVYVNSLIKVTVNILRGVVLNCCNQRACLRWPVPGFSQLFPSYFSLISLLFLKYFGFPNYFSVISFLFLSYFSNISHFQTISGPGISQSFLTSRLFLIYFSVISQLFLSYFSTISQLFLDYFPVTPRRVKTVS